MFGKLFKQKDEKKYQKLFARRLYSCALAKTRDEGFYAHCGVPDSFDGRFDLLLLQIFLILRGCKNRDDYDQLSQDLFDEIFKDMDQVLRERGIGDMGIPKHMRRMMKAFNGRMHAYQIATDPQSLEGVSLLEAIAPDDLRGMLRRNLFGTVEDPAQEHIDLMERYVLDNINEIAISDDGSVTFAEIKV